MKRETFLLGCLGLTVIVFTAVMARAATTPAQFATATSPTVCSTVKHSSVSVGVTAVTVPTANLGPRRYVEYSSSPENVGTPKIKCRFDGTDPVMGLDNPGDVFKVGDSKLYPFDFSTLSAPRCISDVAATRLLVYECY